jgi:pimeloyl-ACP methyl ester carboxylesterase
MRRLLRYTLALLLLGTVILGGIYTQRPGWLLDAELARLAWRADVGKHEIDATGHRWSYFDGGSGETVVLVHGFAANKETWLELAPALTARYRVIIPDLPGWGASQRIAGEDYDVRAQAARLRAFMAALGMTRVHLVGHSMGGHIAGIAASRRDAPVATLTLIATAGVHFTENDFARRVFAGETPFNAANVDEYERFLGEAFAEQPFLPRRIKGVLVERAQSSQAFQAELLKRMVSGRYGYLLERRLPKIAAPTLVIWGDRDRILDVSSTETIARIKPDAPIEILPGCGHMPIMEREAEVAALLLRHFAAMPQGRG